MLYNVVYIYTNGSLVKIILTHIKVFTYYGYILLCLVGWYIEKPYCRTALGHGNKFSKSDTILKNSYRPCSNMDKYLTTTRVDLVGYIFL